MAQKRKYSIEEGIQMAQARFTVAADGTWPRRFKELCPDPKRRTGLTRLIKTTFVKGYVQVVPTDRSAITERLPLPESELMQRFDLRSATVIRPAMDSVKDPQNADELNDAIHSQLGRAKAAAIMQGGTFRDGDKLACSSGRSAYHAVHYFAEGVPSGLQRVELLSLAGRLDPQHYVMMPNVRLDADYNTQEWARGFYNPVKAHYVQSRLVCASQDEAQRQRRDISALAESTWKDGVDFAITGLGILRPGHRLYTAATQKLPDFARISKLLDELLELSDTYSTADFCPVADIANHLIAIRPLDKPLKPSDEKRLDQLISMVNAHTLTVSDGHLKKIRAFILICGTLQKSVAAYQVLRQFNVRYFCTDADSAAHIIELDKLYGRRPVVPKQQKAHNAKRLKSQKTR